MSIRYGHDEMKQSHLQHRSETEDEGQQPPKKVGRPKGALGRRHLDAKAIVEKAGVDPLEFLLRVVKNRRIPIESRIRAAQAAAIFVHPKLSSSKVDITAAIENRVEVTQIHMLMQDPELVEAAEKLALGLAALPQPTGDQLIDVVPEAESAEAAEPAVTSSEPDDDHVLFFPSDTVSSRFNPSTSPDEDEPV